MLDIPQHDVGLPAYSFNVFTSQVALEHKFVRFSPPIIIGNMLKECQCISSY